MEHRLVESSGALVYHPPSPVTRTPFHMHSLPVYYLNIYSIRKVTILCPVEDAAPERARLEGTETACDTALHPNTFRKHYFPPLFPIPTSIAGF